MSKTKVRHSPEQIVRKLRGADAILNSGQDLVAGLQALEVNEATYHRWWNQYGGMKSEEAKRPKALEDENRREERRTPFVSSVRSTQSSRTCRTCRLLPARSS